MTLLLTAVPEEISGGKLNIDMDMTTGDARVQLSINGRPFKDIESSVKTAGANFNISVPSCRIQSVITGDATVEMTRVPT